MSRVSRPARAGNGSYNGAPIEAADGREDGQVKQVLTSAAVTGIDKPAGVPSSVWDAARQAKPASPGKRGKDVPLNADSIAIEHGVPIPSSAPRAGQSACRKLLERMHPGDSVVVGANQVHGLRNAAVKHGVRVHITVRMFADGTARVWRIAPPPAGSRP